LGLFFSATLERVSYTQKESIKHGKKRARSLSRLNEGTCSRYKNNRRKTNISKLKGTELTREETLV